jgi:hypothetical protein
MASSLLPCAHLLADIGNKKRRVKHQIDAPLFIGNAPEEDDETPNDRI